MSDTAKKTAPAEVKEATVRIMLPLLDGGDTENVDQSVPLTVNGKNLIVQRGQVVDLPVPYYLVLKQSGKYNV